jgi:ketosteroid isomerase-like protein
VSRQNVELVRNLYVAVARKDEQAVSACYHPDVEWRDNAWLDVGVHRGFEGVKAAHRSFFAQFEQATFVPHDFVEVGDDRVVVTVRTVGRGRGSGVDVEREVSVVYTVREGKITRADIFNDRAEALDAAGLGTSPPYQPD